MQTQRERFGLVPWIVSIVTIAAVGFGVFRKAVAFSETNGAADGACRAGTFYLRRMLKLSACRRAH